MLKVFITGATGFIGSNLVKYLLSKNYDIYVLIRSSSKIEILPKENIKLFIFDGDIESLIKIFKEAKPDVVYHIASMFISEHNSHHIPDLISSNILFSTLLVEAMVKTNTLNLINIGTSWQHYKYDSSEYLPVNLYSATKQAFIDILRYYIDAENLRAITLKLFDTYGPNDNRKKLLNLLKDSHLYGTEIALSPGEQMIDLVYIDDVVRAITMAGEMLIREKGIKYEEYSVDTKQPIKVRDLVKLYEEIAGVKLNVKLGAKPYRKREVFKPWEKGKWLPGWEPQVSLSEGLRKFIESYTKLEGYDGK